jgi:hypothetical protein
MNEKPAVEFVEALGESAQDTLKKCLEKLGAPAAVIALADNLTNLEYYLEMVDKPGQNFGHEGFDIQEIIIETVNNVAALGGTFGSPIGGTMPRPGSMLAEVVA